MATSAATLKPSDLIYLRDLHVNAAVGDDAWHRPNRPQPVVITLSLHADIVLAGKMDDVSKTINYGSLCKSVMAKIQDTRAFENFEDLSDVIATTAFQASDMALVIKCTVLLPKASLLAEGVGVSSTYEWNVEKKQGNRMQILVFVKKLRVACIIGVNAHERIEKQIVVIDIRFHNYPVEGSLGYAAVIGSVVKHVEDSSYETIEALATSVARITCVDCEINSVTVSVEKPSALTFVDGAGVEIRRSRAFFTQDVV